MSWKAIKELRNPEEKEKVAYINMIRDPIGILNVFKFRLAKIIIARFESFYYFSRFGNNLGGGGRAKLNEERKAETVDECVAKKRQECVKPWWQIVPYLCGQVSGSLLFSILKAVDYAQLS